MGVIMDDLAKRELATNATTDDQDAMNKATTHYLTKADNGPKASTDGFGNRTAAPRVVGSAVGSVSGDASQQQVANLDEIMESPFEAAVRRQVTAAGGTYKATAVGSDGHALGGSLADSIENVQRHSGLLNALVQKARQRNEVKPQPASESATGGASSDCGSESGEMSKLLKRAQIAVVQYFSGRLIKTSKNPADMTAAELHKLLDTLTPGTPAYLGVNRLLARAMEGAL